MEDVWREMLAKADEAASRQLAVKQGQERKALVPLLTLFICFFRMIFDSWLGVEGRLLGPLFF
jgi:hypothetical protein